MTDTLYTHRTDAQLIVELKQFGLAQEKMAGDSSEDRTHWHHVAIAHLLFEAARRLEMAGEMNTLAERTINRQAEGLLAIHNAPNGATVDAVKRVAYDIALNCIDGETARHQIVRRSKINGEAA